MADRELYRGYALQAVDDKGRVAVPASLRQTIERNTPAGDGRSLTLSTHDVNLCLVGYDDPYSRILYAELKERERSFRGANGEVNYNIARSGFGAGEAVPFDSSGRFIMPPFPRAHAAIKKFAFFYGVGDYFEVWDPATLVATEGVPEVMKSAARFYMAERGAAL